MSLLCPPVATAVKYCLSHFSAPNWSHSDFFFTAMAVKYGVNECSFKNNLGEKKQNCKIR